MIFPALNQNLNQFLGKNYTLLDSGDGMKLERFGGVVLARPSSLSMWSKGLSKKEWDSCDAYYDPKSGWKRKNSSLAAWEVSFKRFRLILRLQDNGQVGIFPEHATSLFALESFLSKRESLKGLKVLNLFAYTGMASIFLASLGAVVTHIDLSKKALSWAKENLQLNKSPETSCRLIPDDAAVFLSKEVRRKNRYDVVIIDPPSFSRQPGGKAWQLEEVITKMIAECVELLSKDGALIFSCHHTVINSIILQNFLGAFQDRGAFQGQGLKILEAEDLSILEAGKKRALPAGCFVLAQKTE